MNSDLEILLRKLLEGEYAAIPQILDLLQERAEQGFKPTQLGKFKMVIGFALEDINRRQADENVDHTPNAMNIGRPYNISSIQRNLNRRIREIFWEELITVDRAVAILTEGLKIERVSEGSTGRMPTPEWVRQQYGIPNDTTLIIPTE
jgi:hypothetical protein